MARDRHRHTFRRLRRKAHRILGAAALGQTQRRRRHHQRRLVVVGHRDRYVRRRRVVATAQGGERKRLDVIGRIVVLARGNGDRLRVVPVRRSERQRVLVQRQVRAGVTGDAHGHRVRRLRGERHRVARLAAFGHRQVRLGERQRGRDGGSSVGTSNGQRHRRRLADVVPRAGLKRHHDGLAAVVDAVVEDRHHHRRSGNGAVQPQLAPVAAPLERRIGAVPRIPGQFVVDARGRGARQAEADPVGAEVLGLGRRAQRQPVSVAAFFDVRIARGEGNRRFRLGVIVAHEQHRIPPAPQILISGRVREPVAWRRRQVQTHVASAVRPVGFHHIVVFGRHGDGSGRRARRDCHSPPPGAARRQESAEVRHIDRYAQILLRRRVRIEYKVAGFAFRNLVPDDFPLRVQR